jgi:integrase
MASIKKRDDGVWRARYRDAAGREHAKHFVRKVDAQRWIDETTTAVVTGAYVDPRRARMTVAEWSVGWLEGRSHLKPKTVQGYESLMRTRVLPRWGDMAMTRVTRSEVVAWVSSMRASGLSASRTRQAFHLLSRMLEDAVRDSRLARNPAAGVDLPRMPVTERRYLTHAEIQRLADKAGRYQTLVLLLAYTGIRWGEVAALRVRNVDPQVRGRIQIVASVADISGQMVYGSPKSHAQRSVPVPAFLREPLAEQLAGRDRDDLVFTAPQGGPLRLGNWRRRCFDPAVREAGLDGLVPHELRHTAASLAIASGASVKAVQKMLGHASAAMTLDIYGHLFSGELDAVAARLDEAYTEAAADFLRTRGENEAGPIALDRGRYGL